MSATPRSIGKYEILGEIGHGAMGTVHKARDPILERVVALKTMFAGEEIEADDRERFFREARSAARLQHPNIITIYELGEVDGKPYIAMEFLEGLNLAEAVERGRIPDLQRKLRILDQLCRALHYAHTRGVVHRDVKPSNIFVLPDGSIKVLDFGIARLEGGTFATRTGMLLGTPSYMAPEQFTTDDVDHRVDEWAVGIILYELVTGRRPFDAGTVPSLIYRIVHAPMPEIDPMALGIPAELVPVVSRALHKDPEGRFPDLEGLGQALRRVLAGDRGLLDPTAKVMPDLDHGAGENGTTVMPGPRPPTAGSAVRAPVSVAPGGMTVTHGGLRVSAFREAGSLGESLGLQVIALPPDEQVVAVGGTEGSIRIWDMRTRMKLLTLRSRVHLRMGHAALTTCLAYTADGALLASGHLDGSIYLWDAASGLEAEVALRHEGAVGGMGFVPDGKTLASGGLDSALKCWEVPAALAGEARRRLRHQPAQITCLAVSPDGAQIVSGHSNRSVRIHDTESGRLLASIHGHGAAPSAIAISPDCNLLATGCRDRMVRIFRFGSRELFRLLEGHNRAVCSVAFLPDGRHVASVAGDNGLVIWDLIVGDQATTLWGHVGESFLSVAVLDGGRCLACGLADGRVRLWEVG